MPEIPASAARRGPVPRPVRVLCVGVFPALQRLLTLDSFREGEVNRVRSVAECASGKALNAARSALALGDRPTVLGFAGGETGRRLGRLARVEGIDWRPCRVAEPVRICQTLLETGRSVHTEIVEEAAIPPLADWERLSARVARAIRTADVLVLSGNLPPGSPAGFYARWVRLAGERGIPALVDARGAALLETLPEHPALVKPNREELALTLRISQPSPPALPQGQRPFPDAACLVAGRALLARGALAILVTDGARPGLLLTPTRAWRFTPPAQQVVNPIGAGDALTGALAGVLATGSAIAVGAERTQSLPGRAVPGAGPTASAPALGAEAGPPDSLSKSDSILFGAAHRALGAAVASCQTRLPGALNPADAFRAAAETSWDRLP